MDRLKVPYDLRQQRSIRDSQNRRYVLIGEVDLRWHKKNGAKSHPQHFCVVNTNTPLVILGKTCSARENQSAHEIHALGLHSQTAGMARCPFEVVDLYMPYCWRFNGWLRAWLKIRKDNRSKGKRLKKRSERGRKKSRKSVNCRRDSSRRRIQYRRHRKLKSNHASISNYHSFA